MSNLVYMLWFKKRPKYWTQLEENRGWISDLARYNTEVAHGIVHTDEWKTQMAVLQARFNRLSAEWPPE